ncbi:MAG: hypothetical protein AAFQ02_05350 [Bacteroidota bacterium]
MIAAIRNRIFQKHYARLLSRQTARRPNVNTFSTVTILVEGENARASDLRAAKKYFEQHQIQAYPYLVDQSEKGIDHEGVSVISRENCTWYGVPNQELLINWLAQKTDLLITSNPNDLPLLRYLNASSNSRLKASLAYETSVDPAISLYVQTDKPERVSIKKQSEIILSTLQQIGLKTNNAA